MTPNDMMTRLLSVLVRRNGALKTISQEELDAAEGGGVMVDIVGDKLELRFLARGEFQAAIALREMLAADIAATDVEEPPPWDATQNPPPPPPSQHGFVKKSL